MNNGAFGENFPYSNFHDLNMDWIIKIAKDFLDQYTHIQEIISNAEQSLQELTDEELEQIQSKANELETLLQQWYDTHSQEIAEQLASALSELSENVNNSIQAFQVAANQKADEAIQSIPSDYTELYNEVLHLQNILENLSFEGYDNKQINVSGTYIPNTLTTADGRQVTANGWTGLNAIITPLETYLITGTGNPAAVIFDSSNNVIDTVETTSLQELTDYEYSAPANAHHIIINRNLDRLPILKLLDKSTFEKEDFTIEGYEIEEETLTGTIIPNTLTTANGPVTVQGWTGLNALINPGNTYYLTGTGNPAAIIYNSSNTVIDTVETTSLQQLIDYEYIAPVNAHHIIVNRNQNNIPIIKTPNSQKYVQEMPFVVANSKENNGIIKTSKDKYENEIGLFASNNGSVNLVSITYNNLPFKNCGDDIAPILLNGAGYVGANHGYNLVYNCTSNNHGLTNADIGKTYNDGTNIWVLIKIPDTNHLDIICFDSDTWYHAKTETVPSTVNFGTVIIISSSALTQYLPSVKRINNRVIRNDKITTIIEEYNIIDFGDGILKIIDNVGNNNNNSLTELADSIIKVSNAYSINRYGSVTIYTDITKLKNISIDYIYGSQSMAFDTDDKLAVIGTTIESLQTATMDVIKSIWKHPNIVPSVFIKSNNDKSKAFVLAFLQDRTNDIYNVAGYVLSTTKKLYPIMMERQNTKTQFTNTILRIPLNRYRTGYFDYIGYAHAGNSDYVFLGALGSVDAIFVPEVDIFGKTMSVVDKTDSITVEQNYDTPALKVQSIGEGYVLLKFT